MTAFDDLVRAIVRDELAKAKPANDGDEHVTVAQYAARYAISERTVRDAIRDNRLPSIRIGRAVRVPPHVRIAARAAPSANPTADRARLRLLRGARVG